MQPQESYSYESEAIPESHPARLLAIATLFGLNAPSLESAKILEVGCSSANNLLPLASVLPGARFTGIDRDSIAIEKGEGSRKQLGLTNVSLISGDFREIEEQLGEFDVIIAHGLYSWIDSDAQESLLEFCEQHLATNGILYLSYNTFPGWHLRLGLREMMLSAANSSPPGETSVSSGSGVRDRLYRARQFAGSFRLALQRNPSRMGDALIEQLLLLETFPDWFLMHDMLGEENHPTYFTALVERAGDAGLRYLGDAELRKMAPVDIDSETVSQLSASQPGMVELEQTLDYLRMESFRRSLFCKAESKVLHHEAIGKIPGLLLQCPLRESTEGTESSVVFLGPARARLETSDPVVVAALRYLSSEYPRAVSYAELKSALPQAGASPENPDAVLTQALFRCLVAGLVYPWSWSPPVTGAVTDKPEAFPFARESAARESGAPIVSLIHGTVNLSAKERKFLALLDGTRSVAQLETESGEGSATVAERLQQFARLGLLLRKR